MSAATPNPESRLVVLAQLGDREALDQLLATTQVWLHRYLRRLVGDSDLTLEVLQDVFLAVCRNLTFLHEARLYRPWVYRIASRQAFRSLRNHRQRRDRELPVEIHELAATEPQRLDPWLREALRRGVAVLPPKIRAVFLLHYYEELSLRDTAEILSLPTGTVKSRLAHGLELLRSQLPEEINLESI